MRAIVFILSLLLSLLSTNSNIAQVTTPEVMFVITNSGDSILTNEIIKKQTNEDQVTFLMNGKLTTFQANEIKSYFKKSRKHHIFIRANNQHKLARIIVRGPYQLAQAFTAKGTEKFYLQVNQEWINLDPHIYNLATFLPTVLPNFQKAVTDKKIFYNSPSLGNAISKYNIYNDPNYSPLAVPGYSKKSRVGLSTSVGSSSLSVKDLEDNFSNAISFNIGIQLKIRNSRQLSLRLLIDYASSNWENDELKVNLNRINLSPLINFNLIRSTRHSGISIAAGPVFIFDANSKIEDSTTFSDEIPGLRPINLGFDFQLLGHLGRKLELFTSYQFNPSVKTKEGIRFNQAYGLKINNIRGGLTFYFN